MATRRVRMIEGEDWYEHPRWYDVLHAPGTAREVRGMERIASRFVDRGRRGGRGSLRVFEPGCGTARHLRIAASRGHGVVGLDSSGAMLGYARDRFAERGLSARLVEGDMAAFAPAEVGVREDGVGRFDLAFCLANTVRHLGSDRAMVDHLRCVAGVLRPGGVYGVGIGVTVYGLEELSEDVWNGARGSLRVTQVVQYLPGEAAERVEGVVSHLAAVTPSEEAHLDHRYELRTYDSGEWGACVERAGLEVVAVVDEDGEDLFEPGNEGWRGDWMGYGVFVLRPREP